MREIMLKDAVELRLPAQQEMMLVMRLTTAGVVARAGLTVDRLDDVKLAVEEACTCLIESENPPERVLLRFEEKDGMLCIRICGGENCGGVKIGEDEASVVRCILESLVDSVELRTHENAIGAIELRIAMNQ